LVTLENPVAVVDAPCVAITMEQWSAGAIRHPQFRGCPRRIATNADGRSLAALQARPEMPTDAYRSGYVAHNGGSARGRTRRGVQSFAQHRHELSVARSMGQAVLLAWPGLTPPPHRRTYQLALIICVITLSVENIMRSQLRPNADFRKDVIRPWRGREVRPRPALPLLPSNKALERWFSSLSFRRNFYFREDRLC
jgi:hypothetical protein